MVERLEWHLWHDLVRKWSPVLKKWECIVKRVAKARDIGEENL